MKTLEIKTLQQLWDLVGGVQLNAQDFINKQIFVDGKGWTKIEIASELREEFAKSVAEQFGGWEKTKKAVYSTLRYGSPRHWTLERVFLVKYGEKIGWRYVTGQDHIWETAQARKALK